MSNDVSHQKSQLISLFERYIALIKAFDEGDSYALFLADDVLAAIEEGLSYAG